MLGGEPRLIGSTFSQNHSYSGFVERPSQVEADIRRGCDYFLPGEEGLPKLELVRYPEMGGGDRGGLKGAASVRSSVGDPLKTAPVAEEPWSVIPEETLIKRFVTPEQSIYDRADERFEIYRVRRLYAEYPIQ